MENPYLDLGRFLGRREAFAAVAGRCSAADAESLRQIRDRKLYEEAGVSWDEFCSRHLGSSRRQIDRTLRLLDEFGPAYFHVAQMTRVSPDEYRAIAPHVGEDGIRVDGSVIAFLPENSAGIATAVAELIRREPLARKAGQNAPDLVAKRCQALAEAFESLDAPVAFDDRKKVGEALCHVLKAAATKGVMIGS